jgi:hypothetical protein
MSATYTRAVNFTVAILRRAKDWQEAQDALANHYVYGPWIEDTAEGDEIAFCQQIIRDAEEILERTTA